MSMFVNVKSWIARRGRISPSMVVACVALLVATSGTAYAVATIGSGDVIDNSLASVDLRDGAGVKSVDVVDDALTGDDVKEHTLSGIGRKMFFRAAASSTITKTKFLTFAGYAFKAACYTNGSVTLFFLWANGPSGQFDYMAVNSANSPDFPDSEGGQFLRSDRQLVAKDTDVPLMPSGDPEAAPYMLYVDGLIYRRAQGSAFFFRSGNENAPVIEIEFDIVANNDVSRGGRSCYLIGTATKTA
jgi:hypothetical protein